MGWWSYDVLGGDPALDALGNIAEACGVGYNSDLDKVLEIATEAIKKNVPHDSTKPVEFMYTEFGDSSINFTLRYWLDMVEQKDFLVAKSNGVIAIKKAFDKHNINIPFPIRTLEFSQKEELSKIVEKIKK